MIKFAVTSLLAIFCFISGFAISFERKHCIPKGNNFTGSVNYLYYWYTEKTADKVTMLYYKTSNNVCIFKGFEVSKSPEGKLPLVVLKFIGKYVTDIKLKELKSLNAALESTEKAVAKALDQKYKDAIMSKGAEMVTDSSYFRGHCNTNWWTPNFYYDYKPAFSSDSINTFITNPTTSTSYPHLKYISDSLKNFGYHHHAKKLTQWGNVFQKVRNAASRSLSDWGFKASVISSDTAYHKRSDTCRFTLEKKNIAHGKKYPTFAAVAIFGWVATYCNFFASDLRKAVFGDKIFNTAGCSADMTIIANNKDFVEIPKKDMYALANAGFYVFLIDKGHITTIYPDEGVDVVEKFKYPLRVVQAGASVGITELRNVYDDFDSNAAIKSYIYLGHLKNI